VASRSTMSVGGAIAGALDAVIDKGSAFLRMSSKPRKRTSISRRVFEIAGTDRKYALELAEARNSLAKPRCEKFV